MKLAATSRALLLAWLAAASTAAAGPADGVWRSLAPPPREEYGRTVFDPVHNRLLQFGGWPSLRADVYELPLAGPRVWRRLATQGTPPAARYRFSLIDDPVRDRLILYGGNSALRTEGETWEL